MKWIYFLSGITPESPLLVILREDGVYLVAYKVLDRYVSYNENGQYVIDGKDIKAFINIPLFTDHQAKKNNQSILLLEQ